MAFRNELFENFCLEVSGVKTKEEAISRANKAMRLRGNKATKVCRFRVV